MATIAQQLNVKEFPFVVKDSKGNGIYYEESNGYWYKKEFDAQGNQIYYESSNGNWIKREYYSQGNQIYYELSYGYWIKREYDAQGHMIYYENSTGAIVNNRPKKVILSMDEIAQRLNIPVSELQIKK